jgi:uncharacterized protein (DUF4415 family)
MLKPDTHIPSPAESAAILAAAAEDVDCPILTDEEWVNIKPHIRIGRPRAENPRQLVSIRYSPEVLDAFRSTGKGWQTRMNRALTDWLKTHSPEELAA